MELYQLQIFVIVAEEGSVTRAAQRLFTTPSSISAHLKALEDELQVELFLRTPRGMQITQKGHILCDKARQTLDAARNLVNHATEMQDYLMGQIHLGLNSPPQLLHIPALVAGMAERCPGIRLQLSSSHSQHILRALKSGELDAGMVFGPVDEPLLKQHFLQRMALVIAVPSAWRAQVEGADWPSLAALPWIFMGAECPFQQITDALFQGQRACPHPVQANDDQTRLALVQTGVGAALLLREEAEAAAQHGELFIWQAPGPPSPPLYCDLSLVYPAHRQHDPLLQALLEHLLPLWKAQQRAQ